MNFKQFILNMVSSVEATVNSKIVAGFITLFAAIAFGSFNLIPAMTILAGMVLAFFGLSSFDYKSTTVKSSNTAEEKVLEKSTIETKN